MPHIIKGNASCRPMQEELNDNPYIDNLKHPRRLICRSSGEDLVVCEMPDGNQRVLKCDGWGYSTFTPEKWRIIERDYLRKSNIEDPVFEEVYEHEPSINTIFYRLR
ncbi:MAG: hypothetical protein IJ200_06610 [Prevotella sp.]|nr:hypothetical protein [Prevotella sp.]